MDSENIGVHKTHCCIDHGCKYGQDSDCPVCRGEVEQEYCCRDCRGEKPMIPREEIDALKTDIISLVPLRHQEDVREKINNLIDAVEKHSEVRILNSPFKFINWDHGDHPNTKEEE